MMNAYRFVVKHITREAGNKLIYGIALNGVTYFLSKTFAIADCKQLDSHPPLDTMLFKELCMIITEIEPFYCDNPSLEVVNQQIGVILKKIRVSRAS